MNLTEAREAGQHGMAISLERAEKADPEFVPRAQKAIMAHLRAVGQASGEDLVDVAIAHGAIPPDARAFGGVFAHLSRCGAIRACGYAKRRKGHGTGGATVWAINQ